MDNKYEEYANVFRALCDPNRLMIIDMLKSGEKCACKILAELNIVQSTLSHHMKILCDSGLVNGRKQGKWMHYSLNKQGFDIAMEILLKIEEPIKQVEDKCAC
ncbi:MAG: metalloregulator ArsR/SmtB family transcription factor [Eubacteriales bacterium]